MMQEHSFAGLANRVASRTSDQFGPLFKSILLTANTPKLYNTYWLIQHKPSTGLQKYALLTFDWNF